MLTSIALGLLLSSFMGFGGYYKSALSKSGLVGAIIIGTAIFGLGGWRWGLILGSFFVSSSLLSRFKEATKASTAKKFAKGSQRDLGQTLANGGVGAAIACANLLWVDNGWLWILFLGAMGTVNADTWATELGTLSRARPRLITTGRPVPTGTSGGITVAGTLAALGGGGSIGLVAWLVTRHQTGGMGLALLPVAGIGGLIGALFDSLLGATFQALYYCESCQCETERTWCCDHPTQLIRGFRWLSNDWVNFLSSIVGAVAAVILGIIITE